MKIDVIDVPDTAIRFAKQMAEAAKELGIRSFSTEIKVDTNFLGKHSYMSGGIAVHYSSSDGRGRPCENLSVILKTTNTLNLVETPESSN
jgi:hypothetical protein